jgi:hypothetical protein
MRDVNTVERPSWSHVSVSLDTCGPGRQGRVGGEGLQLVPPFLHCLRTVVVAWVTVILWQTDRRSSLSIAVYGIRKFLMFLYMKAGLLCGSIIMPRQHKKIWTLDP